MLTPPRDPASQLPPSVPSPITIKAEASAGSAINAATTTPSATSSPIPKPSCPTPHTETNNTGSRTAVAVGVSVGIPLALLAAAFAALRFFEKRKFRAVANRSCSKNLHSLVETIVSNDASYEDQTGEAIMKHTTISAVNHVHDGEELGSGLRSHEHVGELDAGSRDGRVELG